MVTIKGEVMLIWITGGHLFSGTLAASPFFFSHCWLQEENIIANSSELHLIGITTNEKRWKADKAMNRRVTGVLSRGIIGPSTETNIFFSARLRSQSIRDTRFKYSFIPGSR